MATLAMTRSGRRELRVLPPASRATGISSPVLGMLVFLGAEAMFFAGLVSAFVVLRSSAGIWPPPDQPRLPVVITGANTLVLLLSAFTMARAIAARRAGRRPDLARWLAVTGCLGAAFLVVQGVEWVRLVQHGLRIGSGVYGSLFAAIIGAHALHVLGGVVVVVSTSVAAYRMRPILREDLVLPGALYWWFVVGVWPVLYGLVYLS
jgi:heme/copper-type cytochrome/quinol oxidase subunit 3